MARLHVSAVALELGREREKAGGRQGQWGGEDMGEDGEGEGWADGVAGNLHP